MTDINYFRSISGGVPYSEDMWEDGKYAALYGVKLKYLTNPLLQVFKPLRIGVDGYVETGLIDFVNESLVSGDVDWNGHSIYNVPMPDTGSKVSNRDYVDSEVSGSVAYTIGQMQSVSGVLQGNIDGLEAKHDAEIDNVSGVLQNNIDELEAKHDAEIDNVSGVLQQQIDDIISDNPWEWYEKVSGVLGEDTFDVSPNVFDAASGVYDIQVMRNTGDVFQNRDYDKLNDHEIRFRYTITQYTTITVRRERTN